MATELVIINLFVLVAMHYSLKTEFSIVTIASHPLWFFVLNALWLIVCSVGNVYDLRQAAQPFASAFGAVRAFLVTQVVYTLMPRLSPPPPNSRTTFLMLLASAAVVLGVWRLLYAKILADVTFQRRFLIIGTGRTGATVVDALVKHDPGSVVVGYIDNDDPTRVELLDGIPVLGTWTRLNDVIKAHRVSDIVLATTHDMHGQLLRSVLDCVERGVTVMSMPELYEQLTQRIPVEHIGDRWVVFLPTQHGTKGFYPLIKRLMDIVVSSVGILLIAPFVPFIALAIMLDSPGPVFYRPERLGRAGRRFGLWKFRTMVANADSVGDPTFTKVGDSRITRFGRFLRRTHIDELPQFLNIFRGEMSLVGPRPERYVPELEEAIPFYRMRYAVKPGTAGWALVKQGYADGVGDTLIKLQYDLYYIKHQSLFLDLFIVLKTAVDMIGFRGDRRLET